MNKEMVENNGLMLMGITVRTNLKNEMNPETAKIGIIAASYWQQNIANEFKARKSPGVTFSVYTDYESDEYGDYTYFIGEEVESLENQNLSKFNQLTIPSSRYQKFTAGPGKMPFVVIEAWQKIWKMTPDELGGKRKYISDFEIYDQRAADPLNTTLDVYIGIE